MKIQYVGDGTPAYQTTMIPGGGHLVKWQTITVGTLPDWVQTAPSGTFLIDGKPNPGPVAPKPSMKPAPSKPGPGKDKSNG